jgi:hypothetical protein
MSIFQGISGASIPERQQPFRPHAQPLQVQTVDAPPAEEQAGDGRPVSSLLEYYRSRHSAWVAEAESLAQLRDQVRGAADRETLEIVARARKDVRDVITIARQELLVLTEQVRAALGEGEPSPRAIEALKDDQWLQAAVSHQGAEVRDARATVALVANPPASGVNTAGNSARDRDWGAEFDSLIREADNETLRW